MTRMDPVADAPLPPDALEPPPRKRGLGRGLAELQYAGLSKLPDGRYYTSAHALLWSLERGIDKRIAERTAQPVALQRLPEPEDTGPINVAAVLAAQDAPAAVPRPRTLSESAAILQARLEHPSEAIRASEPVAAEREPEPAVEVAAAPSRFGKFSALADEDEDI